MLGFCYLYFQDVLPSTQKQDIDIYRQWHAWKRTWKLKGTIFAHIRFICGAQIVFKFYVGFWDCVGKSRYTPVNWHSNGKWAISRCISYWKWGYSIAKLVYQRVMVSKIFHFHQDPWRNDPLWRSYFSDEGFSPRIAFLDLFSRRGSYFFRWVETTNYPRKLQHTPRAHPRQSPSQLWKESLCSLLVKV